MSRFASRKFLLVLAAVVFAAAGAFGGQLSYEQAADVVRAAVIAYLAAEGAGDAVARFRGA